MNVLLKYLKDNSAASRVQHLGPSPMEPRDHMSNCQCHITTTTTTIVIITSHHHHDAVGGLTDHTADATLEHGNEEGS